MKAQTQLILVTVLFLIAAGCWQPSPTAAVEVARFPIDDLHALESTADVALDSEVTHDGNGALRIEVTEPRVVELYQVADPDVEDTRLVYRAYLRSENLEGQAYLEMWCIFDGQGEYFSRGLTDPLSGTVEWTSRQIPFFLKAGENPDRLQLNLVIEGRGTVWIDDIVVSREP